MITSGDSETHPIHFDRPQRRRPRPSAMVCPGLVLLACCVALLALAAPAAATQVEIFRLESQESFLAGTLDGVSVDPSGRLELADRVERVTTIDEPFLFSAAVHPDGWVVGTGNDGRVLLVRPSGEVDQLFSAAEGQVFAVWADPDGTVYAGTSPGGKIYRIPRGGVDGDADLEPWVETGETYVWDIVRGEGSGAPLLVATGTSGRLLSIDRDGTSKVLYDSADVHIRTLLPEADGSVLAGTAGEGLILRVAADGTARTLHDAAQPEIVALARGPEGSFFAAAIASEASAVDLSAGSASASSSASSTAAARSARSGSSGSSSDDDDDASGSVSVSSGTSSVGSRPASYTGDRSQILRVSRLGVVEPLASFDDETVFALAWAGDTLWIGTGLEGKVYRLAGDDPVLEKDLDERQVVELLAESASGGASRPVIVTTNAPAVYRMTGGKERSGTYTSPALDADQAARFGVLHLRGSVPRGARVEISARSGMSSEPDQTWSPWTTLDTIEGLSGSEEVSLSAVPRGRYVQWRAQITSPSSGRGSAPRIDGVELSYRQENLRPVIESFEVMDPGEILVESGFNPISMVFEPTSPTTGGIFTTLERANADDDPRLRTLYKLGWRTFRWEAEDPNDDELQYRLEFRPESDADLTSDDGWLPVEGELDDANYGFDAAVLPDGVYRFRLTASDAESNAPGTALEAHEISEPVVVDHTPPRLVTVDRSGNGLRVALQDALNPIRSVELSLDAGDWQPVGTADGLLDGRRETVEIDLGEDNPRLVLLRVLDAANNAVTLDLSAEVSGGGR